MARGRLDLVGRCGEHQGIDWGVTELAKRPCRDDLAEADNLPADTRLWAALQAACGRTWGGCVFDAPTILDRLKKPPALR
jgi:hypothetical protein